ncbi:patatin-like phospholipase family protein [Mycetocola miduiensis]|uniref:NTE family protein n=1 Tax=Mycetocola miduiensis TaxID=995034 RepID=A0A1I4YJ16_9MICO|nr:patatin-like phospholipase family protein [Mycetocola miduiensis]SFN38014.1 NTE family protein [Mycetocola miduiensis]
MSEDRTLGLTLGGGGAFGAAHVGVLQVLAERGIRPGIATGTSSGALVAAGIEPAGIERAALEFHWRAIARFSAAPRWGLLDSAALAEGVRRVLGADPLIEQLPRRFAAVATDLRTRRTVTIDEGPLSVALRSTIAVPGLLPPVRRGGALLADGGMLDNVPVDAARALGGACVIVVRLHAKWENVRMMRTLGLTAELRRDPSVVLIEPEMEGMAQWAMSDVPRLIAEGRRAATVALDAAARRNSGAGATPLETSVSSGRKQPGQRSA